MLDNRLKMCAEMVSGKGIVCDVGTDHAYLATELILAGKCEKVIASDINLGPLGAAQRTVEKNKIEDKVELIRSDGLEDISLDGVSDIVIAGMGGETIVDILHKCDALIESNIRLILQPMTKAEVLRKWLYDSNFAITCEKIAEDGDKLYVVMCAEWSGQFQRLTETETLSGFFADDDPLAQKYRSNEVSRLRKVGSALENGGMRVEAVHFSALAHKLENGIGKVKINEVYDYLNKVYPVDAQEKWDNSGFLVENYEMECSKIMLTLDITIPSIYEAECKGAELMISHHPVIFHPLKKIDRKSPVFRLIYSDIAAICMHTNLDIAKGGTNGVILKKLSEHFELDGEPELFEDCGNGNNLGWVCELKENVDPDKFGQVLKSIFDCPYVRMNRFGTSRIKRFAFCSGAGGSMLDLAIAKKCNAFITGDVKHDVWIDANNRHITLFDCGHFHTENIVLDEIRCVIEEKFPQLEVIVGETSIDPAVYL
ncbi:MAG: Nif3-like dinuclear metal center hexameric protein [Ruminococcus sp.]|nr:Nif3-like dinuclear metal center hexameric protein [Ruminococcus sp.]